MSEYTHVNGDLEPMPESILVHNMDFGSEVTKGGIIIQDDNGSERGIKPRWAQVYKTGDKVEDVKEGDWVLVEHGRWTRGVEVNNGDIIRLVESSALMMVSETKP